MPDLSELDSTLPVKIAGASSSGIETSFVDATANGALKTADIANNSAVYGNLTVGTSPVLLKVGVSNLVNRLFVFCDNSGNSIIYWGFNSSVSTTNYAGRIFKDQQYTWSVGENINIYVVTTIAGQVIRVAEGS